MVKRENLATLSAKTGNSVSLIWSEIVPMDKNMDLNLENDGSKSVQTQKNVSIRH